MIAVCVTFRIKPGAMDRFMPLMQVQADTSLRVEPDCHLFDICTGAGSGDTVFLYELYTDRSAFDLHLASAHFTAFDAEVAEMVQDKSVTIYDTVRPAQETAD